ncbi:cytochrome P450 [Nocardia crassostreae]|uniref:cytochrome P450 n=1 Tax=Nocardia crassostreae TaxID=53428 RepID=UPI00082F0A9C|nr:cytochrome P450 [Nocardia crassostreae]
MARVPEWGDREAFAYPLPLRVINELMGVPGHLVGPLRKCVDGIFDIALSEEAAVANYEEMIGLLQGPVEYRRENPAKDMAIAAGDPILSCPAGANRDPEVYGDSAGEFDPTRTNKDHMAFGYGAHRCPGAPLARLEAQVALPALFRRFPQMKLAVSPDELGSAPGFIANGHDRLPVLLK